MHPLGSRETADNIFYNRRDDRRNRIFQFTDHFRLTDERHLLYKQSAAAWWIFWTDARAAACI